MLVDNLNNLYKWWSCPARGAYYSTVIQNFLCQTSPLPKYLSIAEYADVKAIFPVHKNPFTAFLTI